MIFEERGLFYLMLYLNLIDKNVDHLLDKTWLANVNFTHDWKSFQVI